MIQILILSVLLARCSRSTGWFDWSQNVLNQTSNISQFLQQGWKYDSDEDLQAQQKEVGWMNDWWRRRSTESPSNATTSMSTAQEQVNASGSLLREWLSRIPYLKKPWGRDEVNSTVGSDFVDDTKDMWKPSQSKKEADEKRNDSVNGVSFPLNDSHLLPAHEVLEGLQCRPSISFGSCVEHCIHLIPKDAKGYPLSKALMTNDGMALRQLQEDDIPESSSVFNVTHLKGEGDRGSTIKYMPEDSTAFGLSEVAQLKSCVMFICTEDYVKRTIPGCIDPQGNLVTALSDPRKSPARESPDGYDDLNFYDPGRMEFWHALGLFTVNRWWYEVVHGDGLRLLLLPGAVLFVLSLPILLLVLVLPGLTYADSRETEVLLPTGEARVSTNAMDYDNYMSIVDPTSLQLCNSRFARSRILSGLKVAIDTLTFLSELLSITLNRICIQNYSLVGPRMDTTSSMVLEMYNSRPPYQPVATVSSGPEDSDKKSSIPGTTTLPSTVETVPSPHGA